MKLVISLIVSIFLWFSITAIFSVGFLWMGRNDPCSIELCNNMIVTIFALIIVNMIALALFGLFFSFNKVNKFVWLLIILLLSLMFISSLITLPLLIYRPATNYNIKSLNVTGYLLTLQSISQCSNNDVYPCMMDCKYYTSFNLFQKLELCNLNIPVCSLKNETCCYNDDYVTSSTNCDKEIFQCDAYRNQNHASINQTSNDCTAYFSGSRVYWGIPKYKVGWRLIFFVIFSSSGLLVFLSGLIFSYFCLNSK